MKKMCCALFILFIPVTIFAIASQQYISGDTNSDSIIKPPQNNNIQAYTKEQKESWMRHCLAGIQDPRLAEIAVKFCQCGWQKIANGALPSKYLVSQAPNDIDAANRILKVISQECMAVVMENSSSNPNKL